MEYVPQPNEIYRHFKGNLYKVITLARHSETGEQMVVYQALYGTYGVYVRPLAMFMGKVDRKKYPDVADEARFTLIPQTAVIENPPKEADSKAEVRQENRRPDEETAVLSQTPPVWEDEDLELPEEEMVQLDPLLVEFLDTDSYEEKLNILTALHARITDDMLNVIAISMDLELSEGELENRYVTLKNCVLTKAKYEFPRSR